MGKLEKTKNGDEEGHSDRRGSELQKGRKRSSMPNMKTQYRGFVLPAVKRGSNRKGSREKDQN